MSSTPAAIPRGIEVLVKKASVDPAFRTLLLERRAGAAREIALELDPAEAAMLNAIPAAHLEAIIARTTVDPMSRAAFLGKAAALMIAALGAGAGCDGCVPITGNAPDRPKPTTATKGVQPDRPAEEKAPPRKNPDYPPTDGIRPDRP